MPVPGNNPTGIKSSGGDAKIMKQGHTASAYGSDPSNNATGAAGKEPRDLKP